MVPISAEPRFHMVGLAFRHRAQVAERNFRDQPIKNDSLPVTKKPRFVETTRRLIIQPHTTECASLAGIPRLQFGRIDVPKFYFHQHLNGRFVEDRRGRQFPSVKEACEHAVRRTPVVLRKVAAPTGNTYLATEISDGNRIVCVVRGKVLVEK